MVRPACLSVWARLTPPSARPSGTWPSPPEKENRMTTAQEGQMTPAARRKFVREHRTAIFGYGRKDDGPAMTVLYYIMDGDDLLISTMLARGKAKAVQRNPKVSLCVLDENGPPPYIPLCCDATIDATCSPDPDAFADLLLRVLELMAGRELDPSAREH